MECGRRLRRPCRGRPPRLGAGWTTPRRSSPPSLPLAGAAAADRGGGRRRGGSAKIVTAIGGFATAPPTTTGGAPTGALGGVGAWPPARTAGRSRSRRFRRHERRNPRSHVRARRARRRLPQVGIIDSSRYASLHPGLLDRLHRRLRERRPRRRAPWTRPRGVAHSAVACVSDHALATALSLEWRRDARLCNTPKRATLDWRRARIGPFLASTHAISGDSRADGRRAAAASLLYVSILSSDLSLDQGPHRPVRVDGATSSSTGAQCSPSASETMARLARDPHYFARPDRRSSPTSGATSRSPHRHRSPGRCAKVVGAATSFIEQQIEAGLLDGGVARCHATTRKGKACQRTPLPGRDYCPSHQHLEHATTVAALSTTGPLRQGSGVFASRDGNPRSRIPVLGAGDKLGFACRTTPTS